MAHLESNSERQNFGSQSDSAQAISNEGNAALRATSLQEFTTYRDAGKSLDPNLIPNLTIEGLGSASDTLATGKKGAPAPDFDKAVTNYDEGTSDLREARFNLREAKRDIYGGEPGGDEEGRRDLRQARRELKQARRDFKELLRDLDGAEGSEEIREGLRDLKKVDKEIGKAIRRDKLFDQTGSLQHIQEALNLLDGNTSEHTDRRGRVRGDHAAFEINQGFNTAIQLKHEPA